MKEETKTAIVGYVNIEKLKFVGYVFQDNPISSFTKDIGIIQPLTIGKYLLENVSMGDQIACLVEDDDLLKEVMIDSIEIAFHDLSEYVNRNKVYYVYCFMPILNDWFYGLNKGSFDTIKDMSLLSEFIEFEAWIRAMGYSQMVMDDKIDDAMVEKIKVEYHQFIDRNINNKVQ